MTSFFQGSNHETIRSELVSTLNDDILTRERNIQQEYLAITEKCRYLNSLLPVSRLSAEVLTYIFSFLSWDYSQFPTMMESPYQYMIVAQVCFQWRATALSKGRFWSIYLGRPDHVAVFLQRSGKALLDIVGGFDSIGHSIGSDEAVPLSMQHVSTPFRLVTKSLELVRKQFHRVKTLMLALPSYVLEDTFHSIKNGALNAPALRKIVLVNGDSPSLPNIFSPHHFPALIHLEVRQYFFIWYPPFYQFTTLETIIIRNVRCLGSTPCIIHGLIKVLSNNPRLRVLEIQDDFCSEEYPNSHLTNHGLSPPVSLINLKRLVAHLDLGCINLFLTQCILPPSATTNIRVSVERYACEVFSPTLLKSTVSHLAQKFSKMVGFGLTIRNLVDHTTCASEHSSHRGCEITFEICHSNYTETCSVYSTPDDLDFVKRDTFQFNSPSPEGWSQSLQNTLSLLPLSSVEYLKLTVIGWDTGWREIMDPYAGIIADVIRWSCPLGIRILNLNGSALFFMPSILASLNSYNDITLAPTMAGGTYKSSLLHILHTLVVSRLDDDDDDNDALMTDFGDFLDAFRSQVINGRRAGICARFSKLVLQDCVMERDNLYEFVDSVSDIVHQRGRFTTDPPIASHLNFIAAQSPWLLEPTTEPSPDVQAPISDADLDVEFQHEFATPLTDLGELPAVFWDEYVMYHRVTFDFRGSSGIRIDHSIRRWWR